MSTPWHGDDMENLDAALEQARARRRLPPPRARRRLRERSGVSQAAIARALGVDRATVSRWETGAREPDDQRLSPYLDALNRLAREVV
jgi:DNA-binding transcriptional regulator YiaG